MNILSNNFVQACGLIILGVVVTAAGHLLGGNDLSVAGVSIVVLGARHMDSQPPKGVAVIKQEGQPLSAIPPVIVKAAS